MVQHPGNIIFFSRLPPSLVAQMVKNLPAVQETSFDPWVGKLPCRRKWQPTPVFVAWEIPWTEEPGGLQAVVWPSDTTNTGNNTPPGGKNEKCTFHLLLLSVSQGFFHLLLHQNSPLFSASAGFSAKFSFRMHLFHSIKLNKWQPKIDGIWESIKI